MFNLFKKTIKKEVRDMTIGEIMNALVKANKKQAVEIVRKYAAWILATNDKVKSSDEAMRIAKHNIGYCSGYYDPKTAGQILRKCETAHPIFGTCHAK